MLRIVALAPQALLIALIAYNLVIAMWGWPNPAVLPAGARRRRFRVVIPAHDEEAVIGNVLTDLADQDYPADLIEAWVLADRCTDRTAEIARGRASVVERVEGPDGKAAALSWYLDQHPLQADETLAVVDADNRLPANLLARMADEFDKGAEALQTYLDVANPDASLLASASAVSYWASNRMVQLARHNLGWTADLGGTGMALTAGALAAAGGIGTSTTEDQDLGSRLLIAGTPVRWIHDVRIADEKPSSLGVAVRQRARWASGKAGVRRQLLADLLRLRSPAGLDLAIRLTQPSRTFVALLTGILAVVAALVGGDYLFSWQVWLTVAFLQFIAPLPFLIRDGVGARYLWQYPLIAVFGVIYLPVRLLGRLTKGWYHTPHEGG
jgi:cellulose synthase/poly-beta-1,6-N-acetylglucosamine synthase-like glycosyltransferase